MNSFVSRLLTILLSPVRSLIRGLWSMVSGAQTHQTALAPGGWIALVAALCMAGFVVDRLVYHFRWRPDWVRRGRHLLRESKNQPLTEPAVPAREAREGRVSRFDPLAAQTETPEKPFREDSPSERLDGNPEDDFYNQPYNGAYNEPDPDSYDPSYPVFYDDPDESSDNPSYDAFYDRSYDRPDDDSYDGSYDDPAYESQARPDILRRWDRTSSTGQPFYPPAWEEDPQSEETNPFWEEEPPRGETPMFRYAPLMDEEVPGGGTRDFAPTLRPAGNLAPMGDGFSPEKDSPASLYRDESILYATTDAEDAERSFVYTPFTERTSQEATPRRRRNPLSRAFHNARNLVGLDEEEAAEEDALRNHINAADAYNEPVYPEDWGL